MSSPEDANLRRLNDTYYSSDPADYLRTRWQLLLLAGARSDALAALFGQGLEYEGVVVAAHDEQHPDDAAYEVDLEKYVTMETALLHHHAAETLLRIYIAHVAQPDAPWIDVASRRNPGKFKALVKDHFVDSTPTPQQVGHTFLGSSSAPESQDSTEWLGRSRA